MGGVVIVPMKTAVKPRLAFAHKGSHSEFQKRGIDRICKTRIAFDALFERQDFAAGKLIVPIRPAHRRIVGIFAFEICEIYDDVFVNRHTDLRNMETGKYCIFAVRDFHARRIFPAQTFHNRHKRLVAFFHSVNRNFISAKLVKAVVAREFAEEALRKNPIAVIALFRRSVVVYKIDIFHKRIRG